MWTRQTAAQVPHLVRVPNNSGPRVYFRAARQSFAFSLSPSPVRTARSSPPPGDARVRAPAICKAASAHDLQVRPFAQEPGEEARRHGSCLNLGAWHEKRREKGAEACGAPRDSGCARVPPQRPGRGRAGLRTTPHAPEPRLGNIAPVGCAFRCKGQRGDRCSSAEGAFPLLTRPNAGSRPVPRQFQELHGVQPGGVTCWEGAGQMGESSAT